MANGQCSGGVAGAAHVLAEDGKRVLAGGLDQHIVGFGGSDAELIDADRMDVLAIGGDHGHLQAGNAHIEVGHRGAIDEAQQYLFPLRNSPVQLPAGAVPFIR